MNADPRDSVTSEDPFANALMRSELSLWIWAEKVITPGVIDISLEMLKSTGVEGFDFVAGVVKEALAASVENPPGLMTDPPIDPAEDPEAWRFIQPPSSDTVQAVLNGFDAFINDPEEQRLLARSWMTGHIMRAAERTRAEVSSELEKAHPGAWRQRFDHLLGEEAFISESAKEGLLGLLSAAIMRGADCITGHPNSPTTWDGIIQLARRIAREEHIPRETRRRRSPRLSPKSAQQTAQEMKTAGVALTDGPTGQRWNDMEGEVALLHAMDGSPLETKLVRTLFLERLGVPNTLEGLREAIRTAGVPAFMLFHVVLGAALDRLVERGSYVTVDIDELIRSIGWKPRRQSERETMRRKIWGWMAVFDALQVIGRRKGAYRDRATGDLLDLTIRGSLIKITETGYPAQMTFDDTAPPIEITYVAGSWIETYRGDRRILSEFGDVRKLASLLAGQPSGAWAQSIGLGLNQRWREGASRADIGRVGVDKKLTVRGYTFTRRQLLTLFRPSPTVEEVLKGPHPARAKNYWDEAIKMLKGIATISYYTEKTTLENKRQDWADDWLDQELDIRPCVDGTEAIAEIATKKKARAKALTRKHPKALADV